MDLSNNEKQILLTSLLACTLSGGGSAPHTLALKLIAEWSMQPCEATIVAYQQRAARELAGE